MAILVAVCLCLLFFLGSASDPLSDNSRNGAFIGYSELSKGPCADQLPDCLERSLGNGCLYDAFAMRKFCPAVCNVERCSSEGIRFKHKGFATQVGTALYALSMANSNAIGGGHWRETTLWPSELLKLGSFGIGTYLGNPDAATDEDVEAAVIYSVTHGWNIIDTASNYRYGHAEASVGRALNSLLAGSTATDFLWSKDIKSSTGAMAARAASNTGKGMVMVGGMAGMAAQQRQPQPPPPPQQQQQEALDVTRDMLFVSTKAGFMDQRLLQSLLQDGSITKEDVVQGMHCIHPRCVEASLTQSLARLNLETVDLLYLHNAAEMQLPAVGPETFMKRLLEAFRVLETARADGRIRYYGLATWDCFRVAPSASSYLPLAEVVALAAIAGGPDHGFRYVQVPVNAAMAEAFTQRGWQNPKSEATQGAATATPVLQPSANLTLLELGQQLKVAFFTSGPLMESELIHKAVGALDGVMQLALLKSTASKLLQLARSTPGILSTMVGHKTREYVYSNLQVLSHPVLSQEEFWKAHTSVAKALARRGIQGS